MGKNKKKSGAGSKKDAQGGSPQGQDNSKSKVSKRLGDTNGVTQARPSKSIPKATNSNAAMQSSTRPQQQQPKSQKQPKTKVKASSSTSSTLGKVVVVLFLTSLAVAVVAIYMSEDAHDFAGNVYSQYVKPVTLKIQNHINDILQQQAVEAPKDSHDIPQSEDPLEEEKEEEERKQREEEEKRERKEEERKVGLERKRKEEEEKKAEQDRKEKERKEEEERKRKEREEAERKAEKERKEKERRDAEERKKREKEAERKAELERKEKERKEEEERKKKVKEEADRKAELERKEKERKEKEEAERRAEKERKEKERKEEEERKRKEKEEAERKAEQEKKEKERKEEEEKKRKEKEEAERKAEQERKEKERKEEEERKRKEKEEAERKVEKERKEKERKEEEERKKKEKEEAERKAEKERKEKERKEEERKKREKEEAEKKAEIERKEKERKREEEQKRKEKEEVERKEKERKEEEERKRKEKEGADKKAAQEMKEKERKEAEERKEKEMDKKEKEEKKPKLPGETKDEADIPYEFASITNANDLKIRDELDEADRLYDEDDYEGAVRKYDSILRVAHLSPRAMYGKGLTLDKLGFKHMSNEYLEEAIKFLGRVLLLPDVPDELFLMAGRKLAERQHFRGWGSKAVKTFTLMLERFPEDVKLRCELGVTYMMIGRNAQAKDVFEQVLEFDPNSGFAKAHIGFIYKTAHNDLERAIPLLREGIESGEEGTSDGRFYIQLGDALIRNGQEPEARHYFAEGETKGLLLSRWQRSLYNVKELTGRPFWTAKQLGYEKYIELLEKNWKTIRDEGLAQLDEKSGSFMPEDENLRDTGEWKQFTLYQQGRKNKDNCAKVPKTCAIIDQIPPALGCKRGQVKFSVMSPGIHVWPHTGPTNCRLRSHLGLVVPEGPVLRVLNETRTWTEGKVMTFDDSFEHEVWHKGSKWRLILIVDFWHPELTEKQRRTLSPI